MRTRKVESAFGPAVKLTSDQQAVIKYIVDNSGVAEKLVNLLWDKALGLDQGEIPKEIL